ncbi:DNA methylase [Mangrovactinospora gilvigrisea]|uniref:Methyltransferase n=1 Tax=Mangrovactinospora gilvigrisea TaxID=1428644 RepID=A0A1J7BHB9_9ACTN|nr:site-specific DNA-methyltransferase [Mangrovactinospora gilvigrisea]OIV38087.1 DNA methylase [Mangrovactinospora gilvigrisea]
MPYTLHRGDALAVLTTLTDASIDAVITDPPYNSGGTTSAERTGRTARAKYTSAKDENLKDFPGEARDQHSYTRWLTLILTECYRATRAGGIAAVFCDWRQLAPTTDALQGGGYLWRGVIVWHKPVSRPQKGRFKQECEFVPWGSKGPMDAASNPVFLPGIYSASQPRKDRVHITQKPLEVMRQLVKICRPGGTVCDPFTGSGTTGVAALAEGYAFVGAEVSGHYFAIAQQRLAAQEQLTRDDFDLA